jgi:hypothetical protein
MKNYMNTAAETLESKLWENNLIILRCMSANTDTLSSYFAYYLRGTRVDVALSAVACVAGGKWVLRMRWCIPYLRTLCYQ